MCYHSDDSFLARAINYIKNNLFIYYLRFILFMPYLFMKTYINPEDSFLSYWTSSSSMHRVIIFFCNILFTVSPMTRNNL